MILALAAALIATNLFAAEEIYIYASYGNAEGKHISYKMDCADLRCKLRKKASEESIALSKTKRKLILEAFQTEINRFDVLTAPKPADSSLLKIKFRYHTGRGRLQLSRRYEDNQLSEVSPEMTAVLKEFLELDLSNLESTKPAPKEKKPVAAASKEY
jgi:hypothetical protein